MPVHEAMFWTLDDDGCVCCSLCPHACKLRPGQTGICGVRQNREGELYSLVYGDVVAEHVDPIEKKPLFHFLPGSLSFSLATLGCNFHCHHCQNAAISQVHALDANVWYGKRRSAEDIVSAAVLHQCASVSYTYVEPTVFFEFAHDCMIAAREHSLKNVFVTNGYMSAPCLDSMAAHLDAANVDIKSFSESFYRERCGGTLAAVLDTIRLMKEKKLWVEITTLLIPGENDSDRELREIAEFIAALDSAMPWHVTAFHPAYKMQHVRPASLTMLKRAFHIGKVTGLQHVYMGNCPFSGGENTYCPHCGREVVLRHGFRMEKISLHNGRCPFCSFRLAGVWT